MNAPESGAARNDPATLAAARRFREALLKSKQSRTHQAEVEAAAGKFCQALRDVGHTPQSTLINAKKVIHDAIDGDNVLLAERAITSCIEQYFRNDEELSP